MRFGWRQAIRSTGKNKGKVLEDAGVFADFVIRPQSSDFMGTTTNLNQISTKLLTQNKGSAIECNFFL